MEKSFKKFKLDEKWKDYDVYTPTFNESKINIKNKIKHILNMYKDFTKTVSPKHWRTTGHHYTELKNILEGIENFTEISEKEKMKVKKYL